MSSPHLDDEQLSARLDSSPSGGSDHVDACPSCQARLNELRAVTAAVVAPPPPPPAARRTEAVEAAMRAWDEARQPDLVGPRPGPEPARVGIPRWLVVAAALLVALAAVPVIAGLRDRDGQSDSALSRQEHFGEEAAGAGVVHDGDLGDQFDGQVLGRVVRDRLGATSSPAAAPAAGQSEAEDRARRVAGPPVEPRAAACSSEVRSAYGQGLGPLVYTASLRWQGTPAVLLVYRRATPVNERLANRAFVMSADRCVLLVQQSL